MGLGRPADDTCPRVAEGRSHVLAGHRALACVVAFGACIAACSRVVGRGTRLGGEVPVDLVLVVLCTVGKMERIRCKDLS